MQTDRSAHVARSGFADDRDDPEIARLLDDLDTLYTSDDPPPALAASLRRRIETRAADAPLPITAAASRRSPLSRRRSVAVAAAVLALAALGGVLLIDRGTRSVSAQEIVERSQTAAESATTGVRSFHQRATFAERREGTVRTSTIETWYGGSGRVRQERQSGTPAGAVILSGVVVNGSQFWSYTTENGRTTVEQASFDSPVQDLDRKFAPGNAVSGLPELIAQFGGTGECAATARQQADGAVAGRSVYVIELTHRTICRTKPGQPAVTRSVISVDKRTFLPLKTENYAADGSLVTSHETTSIAFDLPIPDSTFTYTPPPGATVTAPSKPAGKSTSAQPLPSDVDRDCVKREIAAGRESTAQAMCRSAAATPAPTPTPSPRP